MESIGRRRGRGMWRVGEGGESVKENNHPKRGNGYDWLYMEKRIEKYKEEKGVEERAEISE